MKQTAFWREKNGEYRAYLKYSVPIFVEQIYKMQRLEVSGAVRPIYGSLGVKRLKQVASNTGTDSYAAMKRMACNKSRWKAANQSKDWGIRRRRYCVSANLYGNLQLQKSNFYLFICIFILTSVWNRSYRSNELTVFCPEIFFPHLYTHNVHSQCTRTMYTHLAWSDCLQYRHRSFRCRYNRVLLHLKKKGKAVPLQAWSGPEGSRKLRFPDFMTTAQDGGKIISLTHRSPLPPRNAPGTHFC